LYSTRKDLQEKEFSLQRKGHIGLDNDHDRQKKELLVKTVSRMSENTTKAPRLRRLSAPSPGRKPSNFEGITRLEQGRIIITYFIIFLQLKLLYLVYLVRETPVDYDPGSPPVQSKPQYGLKIKYGTSGKL